MEKQSTTRPLSSSQQQQTAPLNGETKSKQSDTNFAPGMSVIYPMHGKCTLVAIENRQLGGDSTTPFYKLEVQRSSFSRSTRQESAIWVPVSSAVERGLRLPIEAAQVNSVFEIFANREYYFDVNHSWLALVPKLEACIRAEGIIGLAKVASFFIILKKKQVVPSPEVNRMSENIDKMLYRELSEVTGESIRSLEAKAAKLARGKLLPDN